MTTGKKRANGEGSLRKRPDGRWEGRYTAGRDPVTGKAIYKNVLAKTQKAGIAENLPFHGLRHTYAINFELFPSLFMQLSPLLLCIMYSFWMDNLCTFTYFCNKISVLSPALHKGIAQCATHEIKDSPVHLNCNISTANYPTR